MADICQRFQLRKTAGTYYLLDMEQIGVPYRPPISVNESGALIWRLWEEGKKDEEVAHYLCATYDIEHEDALDDVRDFRAQIEHGIC